MLGVYLALNELRDQVVACKRLAYMGTTAMRPAAVSLGTQWRQASRKTLGIGGGHRRRRIVERIGADDSGGRVEGDALHCDCHESNERGDCEAHCG
jgi:hypothetical protein